MTRRRPDIDDRILELAADGLDAVQELFQARMCFKEKLDAAKWLIAETQRIHKARGEADGASPIDELMLRAARDAGRLT